MTEDNCPSSITSLKQLQYEKPAEMEFITLDLTSILSNGNLEELFAISVPEAKTFAVDLDMWME